MEQKIRTETVRHRYGDLLFPYTCPNFKDKLPAEKQIPVPAFDALWDDPQVYAAAKDIFLKEHIEQSDLKIKKLSKIGVHTVQRNAWIFPKQLDSGSPEHDEHYEGKWKIPVRFFLPRGSYATLVLKRLLLREINPPRQE